MEIKSTSRVESATIRRKTVSANASGTFAVSEAPESHAQIVTGPGPIAALDSILGAAGYGRFHRWPFQGPGPWRAIA